MAMQPKDYIDQMLVRKYSDKRMNNDEDAEIMALSTEKYWQIQTEIAQVQKTMVTVATYIKGKNKVPNGKNIKPAIT